MSLLKFVQNNLSIKEYASQLRIRGFKLLGLEDSDKREQMVLSAFINGLNDKKLSILVKSSKPKTLQDACNIIKEEAVLQAENLFTKGETCHQIESVDAIRLPPKLKTDEIQDIKKEIKLIKEQLRQLLFLAGRKKDHPGHINFVPRNNVNFREKTDNTLKCFNCEEFGHISRNCQQKCYICGDMRHTSYTCPQRIKRHTGNKIRQLTEHELPDECGSEQSELSDTLPDNENLNCITAETDSTEGWIPYKPKRHRKFRQRPCKDGSVIQEWTEFIEGRRSRPVELIRKYGTGNTLITKRRPEKAANKPIIRCSCENVPVKALLDSGAECNVIDDNLLKRLQAYNSNIKIIPKWGQLKCANGETMSSKGIVWLEVSIGKYLSRHPFKIVSNLFPEVICGIKMMKKCGIDILSSQDCIKIGSKKVPFLSRVQRELDENPVNLQTSILRVENRC